ncbi:MAG: ubiquinone/menaquinone biosynthesis methyltransferase [Terrimicrobiaceae bacterium]|nr:ubiquinone/menaquinone biosynthesis methyltransferase [Terrimicrobiaceae bacterium]
MPETSRLNASSIREAFAGIARRYDLANHLLSGGWDFWWREAAVREVAKAQPRQALDLATGSGDLAIALRRRLPGCEIMGADFCPEMLAEAARKGFHNLVCADALALPFADGSFGAVTVAFGLRNMASWEGAAREAARVLEPGGVFVVLDFCLPGHPISRALYRLYLHGVLPWLAGVVPGKPGAYRYLGASIEDFPSGLEMCGLLRGCGFAEAAWRRLAPGVAALYTARRPAA